MYIQVPCISVTTQGISLSSCMIHSHRTDLGRGVEVGITQAVIIHFELEHSIDIRQLELHAVLAT